MCLNNAVSVFTWRTPWSISDSVFPLKALASIPANLRGQIVYTYCGNSEFGSVNLCEARKKRVFP